jgi:hypothetical protein
VVPVSLDVEKQQLSLVSDIFPALLEVEIRRIMV